MRNKLFARLRVENSIENELFSPFKFSQGV